MNYQAACQWLGLNPHDELDLSMLKTASRRAALREHPDKSDHEDATARFQQVQEAQELITQQIQRGETGANADLGATYGDDDEGYYYDDDGYYDDEYGDPQDLFREVFASYIFESMNGGGDGGIRFSVNVGGGFPDPSFRTSSSSSSQGHPFGGDYYESSSFSSDREERRYDDYMDRLFEKQRRKEEARKAQAAKRQYHEQEMMEKQRQAMLEGRDFFESWNVKQLQGEAKSRGLNINGLQRESLIEILIEDEAKKRLRRQLKEKAPLVDEWVEICGLSLASPESSQQPLNGVKARATDYYDDRYTVEWEDGNSKKKSQQSRQGKSKKARLKAENVRLWGSQPPATPAVDADTLTDSTNQAATNSGSPAKKKKSRKERKQAAQQRQAAKEQQKEEQRQKRRDEMERQAAEEQRQSDPDIGDLEIHIDGDGGSEDYRGQGNNSKNGSNLDDDAQDQFSRLLNELGASAAGQNVLEELGKPDTTQLTQPTQPNLIQCKVKFPKGKKPGDTIEFTNPHIPGQKRTVVIPQEAQPGKFFKVMVPRPQESALASILMCANCAKIISPPNEEGGATDEGSKSLVAVPLRTCSHSCCSMCVGALQGRVCPQCNQGLPTIKSLEPLPYIQQLDNLSDNVKEAIVEEFYCLKESIRSTSKKEVDALEEASSEATRLVDKHYRRASLKVHPDRYGETYRKEFDALTKARDVLREPELRQSYVKEMVDIVCRLGVPYVGQSHNVWIERNQPDSNDQKKTNPSPGTGKEAPLRIDGGLTHTPPKRPRLFLKSEKKNNRNVTVYLPMSTNYQFRQYCTKVTVHGYCGNLEGDDPVVLAREKNEKWEVIDNDIRLEVVVPENGIWDLSWFATVNVDGKVSETPISTGSRADLRSLEQRALVEQKERHEILARRRTAETLHLVRHSKVQGPTANATSQGDCTRAKLEGNYNALHSALSNGRDCYMKLAKLQQIVDGSSTSRVLTSLQDALECAKQIKAALETTIESYSKRDVRRSFKRFVAAKLEQGEGETWVASVSEEELETFGGDKNRLYQLLVEGKKAVSLAFNDTTLEAAEKRSDLFTPKQCQVLNAKKVDIASALASELEIAVQEEEKNLAKERERRRMEAKAASVKMHRGATVKLQNMKERPEMNGQLGIYMGVGEGDAFIVRLDETGEDIHVKANEFDKLDVRSLYARAQQKKSTPVADVPKVAAIPTKSGENKRNLSSWSCKACHFLHEGELVALEKCDLCGKEKPIDTASGWTQPMMSPVMKLPESQGRNESKSKHTEARKVAVISSENSCSQNIFPGPQENAPVASTEPVLESVPASGVTSLVGQANDHKHRPRRCRHGIHCHLLHQSATLCHFYHPLDEIARYHPNHYTGEFNPVTKALSSEPIADSTSGGGTAIKRHTSKTTQPVLDTMATNENRETANKEVLIDSRCFKSIVGKNFKKIRGLMKTSGAKIKIDRKTDVNGMNVARITGTPSSVEVACKLVVEAAARAAETLSPSGSPLSHTKQEGISALSEASMTEEISSSTDTQATDDNNGNDGVENELMTFLNKYKDCLKCSPSAFHEWLTSLDVLSTSDLIEACNDIDFVKTEMQANGLKGFKRGPFTKAVQTLVS